MVTLFVSIEPGSDPMLRGSIIILVLFYPLLIYVYVYIYIFEIFNFVYFRRKICFTWILCVAVVDI